MRMKLAIASALVVASMTLGTTGASAQAYVGKWGANPVQCVIDQGLQGAPMIVRRNRYDQHETHCRFASIRKTGKASWRMRARCSIEGNRQMHTFTMSVQGNFMTVRDARGARNLVRCG
jgi:hypothetical protein